MVVKGKRLTLKDHWEKLKRELKGMTLKQKLEHLWEYYKWVLGVALGAVIIICTIVSSIITLNRELLLSGAIINVDVTPDGYVMLQEGYFERLGGEKGKESVDLHNMQFRDPYTTTDQTYAMDVYEGVMALVAAKTLDYIMFDDLALSFFLDPELLLDLREIFTEEQLADMGSAVIWVQMEDTGKRVPLAIDIRDTVFYREQVESDKNIYLSFGITSPRLETCLDFWNYIKGGQTGILKTALAGTALDVKLDEALKKILTQGAFEKLGCVEGDHRVELNEQTLEQEAQMVLDHVKKGLEEGSLDYLLCSAQALASLSDDLFMELEDILPADVLANYTGSPVALELSALGITETQTYLVFGANTKRADACKVLWELLKTEQ